MKKINLLFGLSIAISMLTVQSFANSKTSAISGDKPSIDNEGVTIILPFGYDNKSESDIACFFEEMTNDIFGELIENHRVASYLRDIGKFKEVSSTMQEGDLYSQMNLEEFLNKQQLAGLNNYVVTQKNASTASGDVVCLSWENVGWKWICTVEILGLCFDGYSCMEQKRNCWIPASSWYWTEYRLVDCRF